MPIYAYRCSNCGHEEDVLQKMSDPLLTDCPACSQATYVKQVTAAGFQLKGSGWYVTDFRDGGKNPAAAEKPAASTAAKNTKPADAVQSTAAPAPAAPAAAPTTTSTSAPTSST